MKGLFIGASVIVAIGACTADRPDSTVLERDSAGIRIVESRAPLWSGDEKWRLSPSPVLQIGAAEGDEALLFGVEDLARLKDGRVVVVNGGAHELRIYSGTGRYITSIGREGDGPGEFRFPDKLWVLPEDSLVVLDFARVSAFDGAGAFVRAERQGPWSPWDRFPDGTFLSLVIPPGVDRFEPGYFQPEYAVVRSRADGSDSDTLAFVPGDELFRSASEVGGITSFRAPFGAVRVAAVHGASVYTAGGNAFEIWDLDLTGSLVRIIRRDVEPRPVSDSDVAAYETKMLAGQPEHQRRRRNRLLREWTYPSVMPALDELEVDVEGNVWARHYALEVGERLEWSVFDPSGRWLGQVSTPAGLAVKEIGSDYILGLWVDDLGVEYVQLYFLEKPRL